ncbi:MAG: beta-lactamase family protein, partial [Pyrinomonadaceae bacterium]|nr:beta-lactamase family protein [Pyrinomonadaceae bacterium]
MSHLIGNFSVLRSSRVFVLLTFFIAFCFGTNAQVPNEAEVIAAADKVMAAATSPKPAPGCAVGISLDSKSIYEKAFGMAELEHGIANTPQTIFESGSVAKQFVSASIILLSLEGKLKIDDPVRKYIPELPDYGRPLTIRHMLNHTSGLRDWGAVMGITGVGRGERIISQALAIDVVMQQRDVDFTPGSEYSYSNSGYQLLTEIVERVSKQSLPEFTKKRFFEPLVMTNSSWRTDYKTLVPGRAQAYAGRRNGPWQLSMPFMNVYGNGGMLTTVGDWLKWNKMLETRSMGAPLVEMMETNGILNDGRKITYALGIGVSEYKGLKQISHGGATAGYRTFLGRWPELKTSIAVLCNGSSMNPGGIARRIVDRVAPKL